MQAPTHIEALCEFTQLLPQRLQRHVAGKGHAHEEKTGGIFVLVVGVLRRIEDVAAALKKEARDRMDRLRI
jgi:hypothetical protein